MYIILQQSYSFYSHACPPCCETGPLTVNLGNANDTAAALFYLQPCLSHFPQIEIKGHNFDTQSNEFDTTYNAHTIPSSTVNMQSLRLNKKANVLNDADLFRRRNSDDEIPFKDAFNVSAMLNSKPYQLSRLSNKKSSISG